MIISHSILDLDPEKSLKSQLNPPKEGDGKKDGEDDGPPLKDDPKFVKVSLVAFCYSDGLGCYF